MKKILLSICLSAMTMAAAQADNLILNSDFEKPITSECRVDNTLEGHAKMSCFTEDLTWNKCAKFELLTLFKDKVGRDQVAACAALGGNKFGFAVKPNTTYKFSLELKGTATNLTIAAQQWSGNDLWKDRKSLKTSLGNIKINDSWQKFSGTFKTDATAQTATLIVQMWWDTQYGPMKYNVGDYVLIDKIVIEEMVDPLTAVKYPEQVEKKTRQTLIAVAAISEKSITLDGNLDDAAWKNAEKVSGFIGLRSSDKTIENTMFMVVAGKDAIYVGIENQEPHMNGLKAEISGNGTDIWKDDVTEIFFGPVAADRKFTQLAVAAGGGRYCGNGNAELRHSYDRWDAKVKKHDHSWSVEIKIPYQLLGWSTVPKPGIAIPFNIGRQRGQNGSLSTWSTVDENFHDLNNFGCLVIGSANELAASETAKLKQDAAQLPDSDKKQALLNEIATISQSTSHQEIINAVNACADKIKACKLGSKKFVVAAVSPTQSPVLPLVPNEITSPPDKITVRAAVNDLKSVPFCITNLTAKLEEYRIILFPGGTYGIEHDGLAGKGNVIFPAEKIKILRGVRVKDRDGKEPVQCFDPLVPLDDSGAVAASPMNSALLWVQFDCKGIKPGKYQGILRVIPLSESSQIKMAHTPDSLKGWSYKGDMLDLPFELEVLPFEITAGPVIPWDVMRSAYDEKSFKTMIDQDVRVFIMSSWDVQPTFNNDGSIREFSSEKLDRDILNHLRWARKYGVEKDLKFGLGLGCYQNFMTHFGGKQFKIGSPEWALAWQNYVKCTADTYQKNGIPLKNVYMEIFDEPELSIRNKKLTIDELVNIHRLAKEAAPEMQTYSWLDCHTPATGYEKLIPYLDAWGFYRDLLMSPEHQELIGKLRKNGNRIWTYRCNTAVNSDLYSYYRNHAWIGYHAKVDVNGFFVYADATEGGWAAFSWKTPPDGGVVMRSGDKIVTTIRNECLKLGNQDIKYLNALKTLITQTKGKNDTVKKAEEFLRTASQRVVIDKAHDRSEADRVREEAIDLILALKK